jgi:hypothetical protein
MPQDNHKQYMIPTGVLFYTLNANRQNKGLASIEEALIARKLGILFTFKTNNYINFKEEFVHLLNDKELLILEDIINEYFDVDMGEKLNQIAIKLSNPLNNGENTQEEQQHIDSSAPKKTNFLSKIKGLVK